MKRLDASLVTPIYVKTDNDPAGPTENGPAENWPDEKVFYLLAQDGLYLCRNHEFFRSCARAPRWPSELRPQKPFLKLNYPRIPGRLLERIVGFFDAAWKKHGGEAAALLAYNRKTQKVHALIPRQTATVSRSTWGDSPIGLRYNAPKGLPPEMTVFCDLHSHCDMGAYASGVDQDDETHRAGLHIVVGRLQHEPPQFHVEAVVDGSRFKVEEDVILGDYDQRRVDFPSRWMKKVSAEYYGVRSYYQGDSFS